MRFTPKTWVEKADPAIDKSALMKQILVNYGMMIGVFILMFALFEGAARVYDSKIRVQSFVPFAGLSVPDPVMGYTTAPNNAFKAYATKDGQPWYRAIYTTNQCGRRVTPQPENPKKHFLAIFGCSIAFGLCLNDDQTIGYYLGKDAADYQVYNFAAQGYGTQHVYLLTTQPIEKEIKESSQGSVGLYVFNTTHIRRVIGAMKVVTHWGKDFPSFVLDDSGNLVNEGSFIQSHPIRQKVYSLLDKSKLLSTIGLDFPFFMGKKNIELVAKLMDQSSKEFKKKFPGSEFYIVFYPRDCATQSAQSLIPYLKKYDIKYILCPDLFDGKLPADKLTVDGGHPTAEANKILAGWIAKELRL